MYYMHASAKIWNKSCNNNNRHKRLTYRLSIISERVSLEVDIATPLSLLLCTLLWSSVSDWLLVYPITSTSSVTVIEIPQPLLNVKLPYVSLLLSWLYACRYAPPRTLYIYIPRRLSGISLFDHHIPYTLLFLMSSSSQGYISLRGTSSICFQVW